MSLLHCVFDNDTRERPTSETGDEKSQERHTACSGRCGFNISIMADVTMSTAMVHLLEQVGRQEGT